MVIFENFTPTLRIVDAAKMKIKNILIIFFVLILLATIGCTKKVDDKEKVEELSMIERIYLNDPIRAHIGEVIEGYTFKNIVSGEEIAIEDLRDKPLIVESFYVGCPSCLEGIKEYNKLYDAYDGKIEIMYLDITEDDSEEYILSIKEQENARDWIWVPYSSEVARFLEEYNIYGPDATFVLDLQGKIIYGDSMVAPMKRVEDALLEVVY